MARELIAETRRQTETEDLNNLYAAGLNVVVGEIMERWREGVGAPGKKDARILNVHLHDKAGTLVGFRFYLVWSEPMTMGKAPVEVLDG